MNKALLIFVATVSLSVSGYAKSVKEVVKECKEECQSDMKGKGFKAARKCAKLKNEDGTPKHAKCLAAYEAHEKSDGHGHGGHDH